MPSPLKRPSLRRLLASLRPPSRAGQLPVQTGFPTSLADLVVKNHVRLRKPKKRRRPTAAVVLPSPPSPAPPIAAEPTAQPARLELSPVLRDADVRQPPKGAAFFRLRPELLALGGAMALALLAVWSKGLVAAFTVASLSLLWIESARPAPRRRRPAELLDSFGRGPVSPIREVVEPETETPRSSSSDFDKGSEVSSICTAERRDLGAGGDDPSTPKRKEKRSLRKIISKRLHKKPKAKDSSSPCDGGVEQPDAGGDAWAVKTDALVASTEQTPSESSSESSSSSADRGGKFPLAAFIPVILIGVVAGKLPATALTVLCVVFSSSIERSPAS